MGMFAPLREWRNGRRTRLKIVRRKAWGFESPLSHQAFPPLTPM
jgi:hypothetical protein